MEKESTATDARHSTKHPNLQLQPHPTARSKAIVTESAFAGTVLLSTPPLSTVLLHSEKGRRCDFCLRPNDELRKCTGCRAYFYCDKACQLKAWNTHHRRICKKFTRYTDSPSYKTLPDDEKLHVLLLAHLIAEYEPILTESFDHWNQEQERTSEDTLNPITTLLSLLPKNENQPRTYNIPIQSSDTDLISHVSRRFANNNFTIHCSRLNAFAHGVFPLASRFFNHSCFPSAVPTYTLSKTSGGIEMNVILIRDLKPGDEVTIPYIDPALPYPSRQSKLKNIYDFHCTCILCLPPYSDAPSRKENPSVLLENLQSKIFNSICDNPIILETPEFTSLRESLWSSVNQLLPTLSKSFSDASHSGLHQQAIEAGSALLVVYCILYPKNYPLIGLHALEAVKVYWNAYITGNLRKDELNIAFKALQFTKRSLNFFRQETPAFNWCHDADPFDEVRTLESMIVEEAG